MSVIPWPAFHEVRAKILLSSMLGTHRNHIKAISLNRAFANSFPPATIHGYSRSGPKPEADQHLRALEAGTLVQAAESVPERDQVVCHESVVNTSLSSYGDKSLAPPSHIKRDRAQEYGSCTVKVIQ